VIDEVAYGTDGIRHFFGACERAQYEPRASLSECSVALLDVGGLAGMCRTALWRAVGILLRGSGGIGRAWRAHESEETPVAVPADRGESAGESTITEHQGDMLQGS